MDNCEPGNEAAGKTARESDCEADKSENPETDRRGGRIVGRILPAAVRLWLKSQTEQIESLSIDLLGRDRDLLSGYIPGVALKAEQAIYQGIHIGDLQLAAADIRINIGQVVRGKPLRLLRSFPISGEVSLTEADLNASLASPLLAQGLNDFWRSLLQQKAIASAVEARYGPMPLSSTVTVESAQVRLRGKRIGLQFYPAVEDAIAELPVIFSAGLAIVAGRRLQLLSPRWIDALEDTDSLDRGEAIDALQNFQWDLGSNAKIEQLSVEHSRIALKGEIKVNP